MGHANREIETKMIVKRTGSDQPIEMIEIEDIVNETFYRERNRWINNSSKDVFFRMPKCVQSEGKQNKKHGFIRVRYMPDGTGQLTVKIQDKGNNIDRIEIDVNVEDPEQAIKLMRVILNEDEVGKISKDYSVHVLENEDTTVSVYQVSKSKHIFLEVEARCHKRMNTLKRMVVRDLNSNGYSVEKVDKSLFDLFLNNKE
jgi:hypothetical protein